MRIVLFENFFTERGTTTSLISLAESLQEYLDAEVTFAYDMRSKLRHDTAIFNKISEAYEVLEFENVSSFDKQILNRNITHFYSLKAGHIDRFFSLEVPNLIHSVFEVFQPHGFRYAYVSQSLANQIHSSPKSLKRLRTESYLQTFLDHRKNRHLDENYTFKNIYELVRGCTNAYDLAVVPHIIKDHSDYEINLREKLGIPKSATVIGSLSASDQFNLDFVRAELPQLLDRYRDLVFLGPNLEPFFKHERAYWLPRITDTETKTRYLNTINIMIHAREMGESFGLAICEALAAGKPVFAWIGGHDRNHTALLGGVGTLYSDGQSLATLVEMYFQGHFREPRLFQEIVKEFSSFEVAERFKEKFLND